MPTRAHRPSATALLALALAACQAPPLGPSPAPGGGTPGPEAFAVPSPEPLPEAYRVLFSKPRVHGKVSLQGPVAGARIQVFDLQGQELLPLPGEQALSGPKGMFSLRFERLPEAYRILATGGQVEGQPTALGLSTWVQGGSLPRQPINLATSLVDGLKRAKPELSRAQAEAEVKRYLGLNAALDLGYSLEGKPWHFDAEAAGQEAQAMGGVEAYVQKHLGGLLAGGTHPQATRAWGQGAYRLQQAALLMPLATWAGKTLLTGAVSSLGGLGMGYLLKHFGVQGDPNAAAFAQVHQELQGIKADVDQLKSEVTSLHDDLARRIEMSAYNSNHNVGTMVDLITFNQHLLDLESDLLSYPDTAATDIAQTKADFRSYAKERLDDALNQWNAALIGSGAQDDGAIQAWNRRIASEKGRFMPTSARDHIQTWWRHVDAQEALTLIFLVQSRLAADREVNTTLRRWADLRQGQLQALRGTAEGSDVLSLVGAQAEVSASTGVAPTALGTLTTALRRLPDGVIGDTTLNLLWRPTVDLQPPHSGRHGVYASPRDIKYKTYSGPLGLSARGAERLSGIGGWRAASQTELSSLLQSTGQNIARLNGVGFDLKAGVTFYAAVDPAAPQALYFNVDAGTTATDDLNSDRVGRPFWMVRTLAEGERYWY